MLLFKIDIKIWVAVETLEIQIKFGYFVGILLNIMVFYPNFGSFFKYMHLIKLKKSSTCLILGKQIRWKTIGYQIF
jgi:hypothetical protein